MGSKIPKRLKKLRESMGFTQDELAYRLHLSRSAVSAWEKGSNTPSVHVLPELSRMFEVSVDTILCVDSDDATISVRGLDDEEIALLVSIANKFRKNKKPPA